MINPDDTIDKIVAKLTAVWAAIGVTSWSEASSALACLLTLYVLLRYMWRDFLRDFFTRRGLITERNANDADE